MRTSNHLIGALNFLTFLLSIPILSGGIWLSTRANNTDCMSFLQWPLIVIGVSIMVVSLAGIAGACYRNTFLMYLYLWAMFIIIGVLIGFIIFAYAVTDKGSGRAVLNRVYPDYYLEDYSGWLKDRVSSESYWGKIRSCVHDSKACAKTGRVVGGFPETADMYYLRKLNPIQMSQRNPFWCRCNKGFIVERKSWQDGSRGRLFYACPLSVPGTQDYGCRYFAWKDEFEAEHFNQPSSSTHCSNCVATKNECVATKNENKLLKARIKALEMELEMARNPEDHACQSSARLHDLLNEINNLHMS